MKTPKPHNPFDTHAIYHRSASFGERVADQLANVGGSWPFILAFLGFLGLWIAFNSRHVSTEPADPYPFILLNLVLSCLAAIQAPIIMMSQNRQEAKDRLRAEVDLETNIKAEAEIRELHTKIDALTKLVESLR